MQDPEDKWTKTQRSVWWIKYAAVIGSVVTGLAVAGGVIWKTFQWFDSRASITDVESTVQESNDTLKTQIETRLDKTDKTIENVRDNLFILMGEYNVRTKKK